MRKIGSNVNGAIPPLNIFSRNHRIRKRVLLSPSQKAESPRIISRTNERIEAPRSEKKKKTRERVEGREGK